jgi:alginate O-acetyltransferase complex protein AlgI
MPNWLALVITFNFVTFAWVFFRAPSIVKALDMFGAVTNGGGWDRVSDTIGTNVFPPVLLVLFFGSHVFDDHRRIKFAARRLPAEVTWPVIALGWVVAIGISQGSSAKFVYFDF